MPLLLIDEAELTRWITNVMWPFARIGAVLLAAPMFGARTVPVRVRVILALLLCTRSGLLRDDNRNFLLRRQGRRRRNRFCSRRRRRWRRRCCHRG